MSMDLVVKYAGVATTGTLFKKENNSKSLVPFDSILIRELATDAINSPPLNYLDSLSMISRYPLTVAMPCKKMLRESDDRSCT